MDPDYFESFGRVLTMPGPQLRDRVSAIDSAVGPELDQHDPAGEVIHFQRSAIYPFGTVDLRCGIADFQCPRAYDAFPAGGK